MIRRTDPPLGLLAALLLHGALTSGCVAPTCDPLPHTLDADTLYIEQLCLEDAGGLADWGESTLVLGPEEDGRRVALLIDAGRGQAQARMVRAALADRGVAALDWLLITHYDGDHVGGAAELVSVSGGQGRLRLTRGLISRGPYNLRQAHDSFARMCRMLTRGDASTLELRKDLCAGEGGEFAPWGTMCRDERPHATVQRCPGLLAGDLAGWSPHTRPDTAPEAPAPAFVDLGGGARLTLYAAGGVVGDGGPFASDLSENDRSLLGVISRGHFAYVFGGDAEARASRHFAARRQDMLAPPSPHDAWLHGGVDVFKLNHHGKDPTAPAWIAWMTEGPDPTRHVIVGAMDEYGDAPSREAIAQVLDARDGQGLGDGAVWVPLPGARSDARAKRERLRNARGNVLLAIPPTPDQYQILTPSHAPVTALVTRPDDHRPERP